MIYSVGIRPALWRPIIGISAFDIEPLEIDITEFLRGLWHGKGERLRVEVSNGQGFEPLKIGDNWIVGASLLHFPILKAVLERFRSLIIQPILDRLGSLQTLITYMRLSWLTKLLKSGVMSLLLYLKGRNSL